MGGACVRSADCPAGAFCSSAKTCTCLNSTTPVYDNSSCIPTNIGLTTSECQSNDNCTKVNGTRTCVLQTGSSPGQYVCACDRGKTLANDTKTCTEQTRLSGGGNGSDEVDAIEKELSVWLMAGAAAVGVGIVITVACVALIMSGQCSGDPVHADAGRPRGMDGFHQLPFVPQRMFRPQMVAGGGPPVSRRLSTASIRGLQASTASLGPRRAAPSVVSRMSRHSVGQGIPSPYALRRQSSAVDQRSMSYSQVDPSEVSMSASAISMSDMSSGVMSDAPTMSEMSEMSRSRF